MLNSLLVLFGLKKKSKDLTVREKLYLTITKELGSIQYSPKKGWSIYISSDFSNIDDLVARINAVIMCVKNKETIPNNLLRGNNTTSVVDIFYTTGYYYTDVLAKYLMLRNIILELCTLLVDMDKESIGIFGYYNRVLSKFLTDITNVCSCTQETFIKR